MKNKNVMLAILLILIWGSVYFYFVKPHSLANEACESTYVYHPATSEKGAYHTAVGIAGPINEFESKNDAIKSCSSFHFDYYRSI